jgi:phenylpropionate dioxygenase-like ring-hydroxylating dioxygenase large terminal subunit
VVQKESGNAKIFSCKYHGWSYDLNGKLAKAPRFDPSCVEAFDSSIKGLFPIHVHVDRNGFVYVNLDAKEVPEISWESQYAQMDKQDVLALSGIDWDAVEYDLTWIKEGKFNWKLMQDNYNEVSNTLASL